MSRVLIIGCGGVASVAIQKCCQVSEVFTEICIASRTKSKCDELAQGTALFLRYKINQQFADCCNLFHHISSLISQRYSYGAR